MFFKTGILKYSANFTGKHLCWSLFLIHLFSQSTSGGCFRKLKYGKKNTTLNSEGLKIGTNRLSTKKHAGFPFYLDFPNGIYLSYLIIKAEKHCAKYVQSENQIF